MSGSDARAPSASKGGPCWRCGFVRVSALAAEVNPETLQAHAFFFAFTNGRTQAADVWPQRVEKLNRYFETYRSGDEYDREAITWVMACSSHLPGLLIGEPLPSESHSR